MRFGLSRRGHDCLRSLVGAALLRRYWRIAPPSGRGAAAAAGELAEGAVGAAVSLGGADVALGIGVLRLGERAASAIPGPLAALPETGSVVHDCPERTAKLSDGGHGSDDTACGAK